MLLGELILKPYFFSNLDKIFQEFKTKEFRDLVDRKRSDWVNRSLLELIQKEEEPCFLLSAVLAFIERVDHEDLLDHYTFTSFELWLNHFSLLSFDENYRIRSKIVGKFIDRGDYRVFFPIGTGTIYEGSHFVTAHKSPDLDTTISSFWGWMDAFGARVSRGLHLWNVPGGVPTSQIEMDLVFRDFFGSAIFTHLVKTKSSLTLSGNDLLSTNGVVYKTLKDPLSQVENDDQDSVVLIDESGFYLEDFRPSDAQGTRGVVMLFGSCLRWFENRLHLCLISFFAKPLLVKEEIENSLRELFGLSLSNSEPACEFSLQQRKELEGFLIDVLKMPQGSKSTFEEVRQGLCDLSMGCFCGEKEIISSMREANLFEPGEKIFVEDRSKMFHVLEKIVRDLHEEIFKIRSKMEEFEVAFKVKSKVFGQEPVFVSVRSDVEEIRSKMGIHQHLTVTYPDRGKFFPMGVVRAADVRKNFLGTVSLRDFCNREEMSIPSYIEVISVIDHHKSSLSTLSVPMAVIGDVQSSNTLVAERSFLINDLYSLGGMKPAQIESFPSSYKEEQTSESMRVQQRILQRKIALSKAEGRFIHPTRESLEYLQFLYGILDDTDLLSKVTVLDVEVVLSLLNRLKSLILGKEVEVAHFDDLVRDKSFPKKAARRLLQNEDLYSLYRKVYVHREREVDKMIQLCADRKPSIFFADTKEQNGCCRVGQTKLFSSNISLFEKKETDLRRAWFEIAEKKYQERSSLDLHIHMVSTVVSADEVFSGTPMKHMHQDELWIWCAPDETGIAHLKIFLSAFQNSPAFINNPVELEFLGINAPELSEIFRESFLDVPRKQEKKLDSTLPIAVMKVSPGSFNSRKALLSPFLPFI